MEKKSQQINAFAWAHGKVMKQITMKFIDSSRVLQTRPAVREFRMHLRKASKSRRKTFRKRGETRETLFVCLEVKILLALMALFFFGGKKES